MSDALKVFAALHAAGVEVVKAGTVKWESGAWELEGWEVKGATVAKLREIAGSVLKRQ